MSDQKVLVTGVFDLLHQEHINFLEKARVLGNKLIVGVESDKRVTELKGGGRPVQKAKERVKLIKALGIADEVFVLPEKFSQPEEHLQLLNKLRPRVLAVSSHTPRLEEKRVLMAKIGGRVVIVHQHNPDVSTTQKLRDVRKM